MQTCDTLAKQLILQVLLSNNLLFLIARKYKLELKGNGQECICVRIYIMGHEKSDFSSCDRFEVLHVWVERFWPKKEINEKTKHTKHEKKKK